MASTNQRKEDTIGGGSNMSVSMINGHMDEESEIIDDTEDFNDIDDYEEEDDDENYID